MELLLILVLVQKDHTSHPLLYGAESLFLRLVHLIDWNLFYKRILDGL